MFYEHCLIFINESTERLNTIYPLLRQAIGGKVSEAVKTTL